MRCRLTIALILFAATSAALPTTFAQESVDLADNAALKYWKAFALFPEFDEQERKLLSHPAQAEINEQVRQIANKSGPSLDLLRQGQSIDRCNWGHDLSQGFGLMLPHLGKARELARMAALRMRVRLADGNAEGAMGDLMATMQMAQHIGKKGFLIEMLVEYAIRDIAINALAADLVALSAAERKELAEQIGRLAPASPIADGVRLEKQISLDYLPRLFETDELHQLFGNESSDDHQLARKALQDPEKVKLMLSRLGTAYDRVLQNMELAPAESLQELKKYEKDLEWRSKRVREDPHSNAGDLLVCHLLPAVGAAKLAEARMSIHRAMLMAAIAYVDGGPEAAAKVTDPVTGDAFQISPVDGKQGWIELASTVTDARGKPVTLTARVTR